MDPIDRKDFNPHGAREPNHERLTYISYLAKRRAHFDSELAHEVREAIATGHSYRQVAEAAGVSVSVIQRMVKE